MKVKRGRPKKVSKKKVVKPKKEKKVKKPKTLMETAIEKNRTFGKKEKPTKKIPLPSTTAFVNKIFHNKDGTSCLVTYSGCKDKPIDINLF